MERFRSRAGGTWLVPGPGGDGGPHALAHGGVADPPPKGLAIMWKQSHCSRQSAPQFASRALALRCDLSGWPFFLLPSSRGAGGSRARVVITTRARAGNS